ncbi:hypothetical protein DFH07DRAFT_737102 [Mycena maculata]|uniref:Uncharacterized protein n=1 Tax=Mycena maculata TaxID=230809 RepID=A0AAD7JMK8_9AGAR|nr:hypothetical protein DFH07DRAFT_737102 [Mycena maculata]
MKGLEGESRILSKRISTTVSISSLEEPDPSYQPRPSYTQQRTSSDRTNPPRISKSNGATSSKRARTYSTPKLSEIPTKSRAQYSEPKPTRIPKAARARSGSINGNGRQSPYTTPPLPPIDSPDPRRINDGLFASATLSNRPSQDTIHIPIRQTSGLLNEPPPFMPGPGSANSHDDTPPRPSNDSEERPFEHWYRGEVSRNGGVGELKLGKRAEMLEIANYGHTLKEKQALAASREAESTTPRRRKRSESAAGIEARRESLYLDEDHADTVGRVLDEGPLTDVEAEMSDSDYYNQQHLQFDMSTSSAPDPRYQSTTPTPQWTPSRQQGAVPATKPAPQMQRGASEPPTFPASSSSLSQSARQLQNPKRAATASPPAASTSASKKPRAAATPKPKPKAKPKRANTTAAADEKNRRSVAYYPSPGDDEDMADAIPSWTQPIAPPTGRWDDVVLPVVARKKGLDRLYEKADGSPKPKKVEDPVAPAPGTFGWDHSKYRPPRDGDIPMDEFGRPIPAERIAEDDERESAFGQPLYPPTEHERQPVGPQARAPPKQEPPGSPVPFSNYRPDAVVNIDLEAAQLKYGAKPQQPPPEDDDGGAGCCKCVVM